MDAPGCPPGTTAVHSDESERWAGVAVVLPAGTALYYLLPAALQAEIACQFLPQVLGYLALLFWLTRNTDVLTRLGLTPSGFSEGLRWGTATGVVLGLANTAVILWIVPLFGGNIQFLRETPHARMPAAVMLPWLIVAIAVAVELNFRGFLLGRLYAWRGAAGPALIVATLAFAFDPFMVATFKHLHWVAIWDGIVWGSLRLVLNNLYATIVAHAVEVMVVYTILRQTLPP